MFTYQLQRRVLRLSSDVRIALPADVEIELKLAPPQPFGAGGGHSRTATKDVEAKSLYDANSGRATIESAKPLGTVSVSVERDGIAFVMRGDVLTVKHRVERPGDLTTLLTSLMLTVPIFLNVDFVDAPHVLQVRGVIGGVPFRWELAEATFEVDITTTERQEERVLVMIERMRGFSGTSNRQVVAALHYFHKACRLLAAGASPWEFMSEAILNFAKVLQALFGEQRDDVRAGLRGLGYSEDDAEKYFIAAMALRSEIDVGHVMTSVLREADLQAVYAYLAGAERAFRELLQRVLRLIAAGDLSFPEVADVVADAGKRRVVDRIVAAWGGPEMPPVGHINGHTAVDSGPSAA
jgi:hypothetical protein